MSAAGNSALNPARGKGTDLVTQMASAKDLPSHTRLKTRKPGQGAESEYSIGELRRELKEAERRHFESAEKGQSGGGGGPSPESEKARYIEMAQRLDAESSASEDESGDGDSSEESDDDGSDSEDETAMLMRELEKIKRERAEDKARQDDEEQLMNGPATMSSNPLLAKPDFSVKRRWDDDVVFRNQAQDDGKPKKRFINDMLRSDFHRKFMRKYVH
ncbi:complexed with cef1p [Coemansia sp. RSA 552]|nr:complexed with cef1p [Coemansia sp. RSA 552]